MESFAFKLTVEQINELIRNLELGKDTIETCYKHHVISTDGVIAEYYKQRLDVILELLTKFKVFV